MTPAKTLLIQTLIASALWALGMVFLFDQPLDGLLQSVLIFAALYWGIGRVVGLMSKKKDDGA